MPSQNIVEERWLALWLALTLQLCGVQSGSTGYFCPGATYLVNLALQHNRQMRPEIIAWKRLQVGLQQFLCVSGHHVPAWMISCFTVRLLLGTACYFSKFYTRATVCFLHVGINLSNSDITINKASVTAEDNSVETTKSRNPKPPLAPEQIMT